MSALRLARGATGRELTVKFEGCYHGHVDSLLVKAGSGIATLSLPDTAGVPRSFSETTITLPYNDPDRIEDAFDEQGDRIAAVIVEPVAGNMGCVLPKPGFLQELRRITHKYGALLIFDEVMTGFRLGRGGAQALYGVTPDITTLGKIIGGGLPIAAYGGRADVMRCVAPTGPVYQAGTLSGNPVAVTAGIAMLRYIEQHPEIYDVLDRTTAGIVAGLPERRLRKPDLAQCSQFSSKMGRWKTTKMQSNRIPRASAASSTNFSNAVCISRRRSSKRRLYPRRTARKIQHSPEPPSRKR